MPITKIIDGRQIAADLCLSLAGRVARLKQPPVLKVILVGDDPASQIYVRHKTVAAHKIGIKAETIRLPEQISERDLLDIIQRYKLSDVDGLLVQLPLPPHINLQHVLESIDRLMDVDGFHPFNVGRLASGFRDNVPCTAKGIMMLLAAAETPLQGAKALVIGCSAIVGRPVCTLLTQASATVTNAHLLTRDLADECRRADILVVAAGCPNLIRADMLKPGVVIIDVGITRLADGRVCGDVAYEECLGIAGAITPVPGGVGPMTIACLLENTYEAALAPARFN